MSGGGEGRIRAVLERWFITEPLLFGVLLTHELRERPAGTLRVGAGLLEYNRAFTDALPPATLEEVLRLEAARALLGHPYQRRPPAPQRAYAASNLTLAEHLRPRLPLPGARAVLGEPGHEGQYFEYYYERLPARPPGSPPRPPEDALARHLDPACSGDDNTARWERDELRQAEIQARVREAQEARAWGSLPGSLRGLLLLSLAPRLDFRAVLRGFRQSLLHSRRELTRMKPSRRYDFLSPGSRYRRAARLLVAVDVSGSLDEADLQRGFAVINQLFAYGMERVDVVQFDCALQGRPEALSRARRRVQVRGGGGTSFAPVLRLIDEERGYDGLIIFTDGLAPAPAPPRNRRTRLLWLYNNEANYLRSQAQLRALGRATFLRPGPQEMPHPSPSASVLG